MNKQCVLYDRECTGCGECDICDLDENKICDNCGKCIDSVGEFRTINVKDFIHTQDDENDEEVRDYDDEDDEYDKEYEKEYSGKHDDDDDDE